MWTQRRILVVAFVICLAFVFTGASLTPSMTASEPQTKLAQHRVAEKALDLSQTYEALSVLPVGYRKAIFRNLTAEAKSELWRTHMRVYLSEHPELMEDQRNVILDGIALATPQLFEIPEDSPEWLAKVHAPLELLKERALGIFPHAVAVEIFAQLGKPVPPDVGTALLRGGGGGCTCSQGEDWCPGSYQCFDSDCNYTRYGCGTLWLFPCDGDCYYAV